MITPTGKIQYYGVYVSQPNWNQYSDPCETDEEAAAWVEQQKKTHRRNGDWGYTFKADEQGKVII